MTSTAVKVTLLAILSAGVVATAAMAQGTTGPTCSRVAAGSGPQTRLADIVRYCCERRCIAGKCWCARWCATGGGGRRG